MTVAKRYLHLGLQLGRHDEGIVDAYFGPPELAAAVILCEISVPLNRNTCLITALTHRGAPMTRHVGD